MSLSDEATPNLDNALDKLTGTFKNFKAVVVGGVFAVFVKVLADAQAKLRDLENSLQKTAVRFQATERQTRDLVFQLNELAKTSVFSTEELAKSLDRITQAGLNASQSMDLLKFATKASEETGQDLGVVSDFIAKALEEGIVDSAEEAEELFNELAGAAASTGVDFNTLAEAFFANADAAMAANIPLKELIRLMATDVESLGLTAGLNLLKLQIDSLAGDPAAIAKLSRLPEALRVRPGETVGDVIERMIGFFASLDAPGKIKELEDIQKSLILSGEQNLATILERITQIDSEDLRKIVNVAFVKEFPEEVSEAKQRPSFLKMVGGIFEELDLEIGTAIEGVSKFGQAFFTLGSEAPWEEATRKEIEAAEKKIEEEQKVTEKLEEYKSKHADAQVVIDQTKGPF
ncbi:MAG: phage tail tape measure protein, partial [Candidatus Diapherotrites archaeon]|nr:phage tail tape measure protein [Candidatus Diapherotrites archaeon]